MASSSSPLERRWLTTGRRAFLEEHGYVVVPGVAAPEFCERVRRELLEFIAAWDERLTPDRPEAWKNDDLPSGTIHGINRLAGQTQAQWDVRTTLCRLFSCGRSGPAQVRQHPNVAEVFAEYWNVAPGDLAVSMDAFNYYLASAARRPNGFWLHTDQGRDKPEPLGGRCVQGLLNLVDSTGDNDGGLVVHDKSHRAWQGYWDLHPEVETKDDWHRYPESFAAEIALDGSIYLRPGDPDYGTAPVPMKRVRVGAPAGAVILWLSKTAHQNDAPYRRNPAASPPNDRAAVYVCMAPKRYLTQKDIKKRRKAFAERRQTSHWPGGDRVKVFPQTFRAYTKERAAERKRRLERLKRHSLFAAEPKLTALGKSLLGF